MSALTGAQLKKAVEMYKNDGVTLNQVADHFKVSSLTIRRAFSGLGVKMKIQRPSRKPDDIPISQQLIDRFNSGNEEYESLAKELGCSVNYAKIVYTHWQSIVAKSFEEKLANTSIDLSKYLTVNKLEDFKETVKEGDKLIIKESTDNVGNSYHFEARRGKPVEVTILKKYPNFAMTDHGAKQWVDIWNAAKQGG